MRKVALDLGLRKTCYCEVNDGQVVRRLTVTEIESLKTELGPECPPALVAIESCREAWYVHDLLKSWGNEVILVDTTRSKQLGIGQHGRKTDRIDAEVLAMAVDRGSIPVAHVLSPERRELRRWLGVRRGLVEARAQMAITARGICREQGVRLPSCEPRHLAQHVNKTALNDELRAIVTPLLKTLETINDELQAVEERLATLCTAEPVIQLLTTVPGVATVIAAAFVSVIDDAKRFRRAHQVESYLGLVPGEKTTGGKRRVGAITKAGNPYMRSLLVQSSWAILRLSAEDDPLRMWGQAVAERRGKRIAVVALARRLVGVLWAMWRNGTFYDTRILAASGSRGLKQAAQTLQERADALQAAAKKQRVLKPREARMSA